MKTKRKSQRGAAMPEAIVVMTVMLVFLGMIMWAYKAWGTKIDQSAQTRSDVLFYASHSCEVAPPAADPAQASTLGGESDVPSATGDVSPDTADALAGKLPADKAGTAGLARSWNMASMTREQVVDGSAIVNLKKVALTTNVKTESWVACNEKNYGGDWDDLAQFVWDLPKNGAGLLGP